MTTEHPMDFLQSTIYASPYLLFFVLLFVRLEHRLTKIETDISWLKKEAPRCPLTSDDPST